MSGITRRRALGAVAGAAAGLTVAAPAIATAAARATAAPAVPAAAPAGAARAAAKSAAPAPFDEVYRGRRIQGRPAQGGGHGGHHGGHHGGGHGGGYTVLIDGEELHVMQNADGTWISVISHYEPVASPRAAARAAVLELQGSPLVPLVTA
ncbi:tyrosinase cofactor [Streptomyces coeruleoprunus]|uniref:Tyrosinase cofactor n=1 Tax=Streptomyces coeruleoprunus TaxID=285563 RepID=A0ABV9XIV3_9ACTN